MQTVKYGTAEMAPSWRIVGVTARRHQKQFVFSPQQQHFAHFIPLQLFELQTITSQEQVTSVQVTDCTALLMPPSIRSKSWLDWTVCNMRGWKVTETILDVS